MQLKLWVQAIAPTLQQQREIMLVVSLLPEGPQGNTGHVSSARVTAAAAAAGVCMVDVRAEMGGGGKRNAATTAENIVTVWYLI